ncbi:MAG: hypothetical protein EOP50_20345 [Sphingobacteriales bacterium]|nr:MAG: hypothetical protein EOP50_20345 [Sphingobacteriales bacterium]
MRSREGRASDAVRAFLGRIPAGAFRLVFAVRFAAFFAYARRTLVLCLLLFTFIACLLWAVVAVAAAVVPVAHNMFSDRGEKMVPISRCRLLFAG